VCTACRISACLTFSWAAFLSFSFCLATTHRAAHFFDSAARAFGVISFLPLGRTVGAVVVDWAEGWVT
jgi:hypothetical protein